MNAGLIEGRYDGITHGSTAYSCDAGNSPAGKFSNTFWMAYYRGTVASGTIMFYGVYSNTLQLGGYISNNGPSTPFLKPEEIWNLDTKMDDGKPATGRLRMRAATISNCTDTSSASNMDANYLLTDTGAVCLPIFSNLY